MVTGTEEMTRSRGEKYMNNIRRIKQQDLTIEWLRGNEGKDIKEYFWIGQLMGGGRNWDRKCWWGVGKPIWDGR